MAATKPVVITTSVTSEVQASNTVLLTLISGENTIARYGCGIHGMSQQGYTEEKETELAYLTW